LFAERHRLQGGGAITVAPEFGPDGYLPTLPFTNQPVAVLNEINRVMSWRPGCGIGWGEPWAAGTL
jgi:hypothetical protein